MPKIDLGAIGAVVSPGDTDFVETAVALETMGFSTVWLTGGPMRGLDQIAAVVRATKSVRVASAIIAVSRFSADEVAALYGELERDHPGRFVVGLGGAHGPEPIPTLNAFLDELDAVPVTRRIMAALGPAMLRLGRDRAAGALPVLVTPEYVARARRILGADSTLAVEQLVVLDTDPAAARAAARGPLGFLGSVPAYQASFRRMGFADSEIEPRGDRLVDALVAWGDDTTVAARVTEVQRAGADHVAVSLVSGPAGGWRRLADALLA